MSLFITSKKKKKENSCTARIITKPKVKSLRRSWEIKDKMKYYNNQKYNNK